MILYSVNYRGPVTSGEWSIVTIHKSLEGAEKAKAKYENNHMDNIYSDYKYRIVEIDTDYPSDCVYDFDRIDEDYLE